MAITQEVVEDLGVADAELVKVEDFPKIMTHGVMSTPAPVIDGKVVVSGKAPSKAEVSAGHDGARRAEMTVRPRGRPPCAGLWGRPAARFGRLAGRRGSRSGS